MSWKQPFNGRFKVFLIKICIKIERTWSKSLVFRNYFFLWISTLESPNQKTELDGMFIFWCWCFDFFSFWPIKSADLQNPGFQSKIWTRPSKIHRRVTLGWLSISLFIVHCSAVSGDSKKENNNFKLHFAQSAEYTFSKSVFWNFLDKRFCYMNDKKAWLSPGRKSFVAN